MNCHNRSDIQDLILTHFLWSRQVLLDKYPWDGLLFKEPDTKETWTTQYLIWAIYHDVLHCFGNPDPTAMVLVRVLDSSKINHYRENYAETLLEIDRGGDTAYVDFCYAPGNYAFIVNFLKRIGTKYIGWTRDKTNQFHLMESDKMPIIGGSALSDTLACWHMPTEQPN